MVITFRIHMFVSRKTAESHFYDAMEIDPFLKVLELLTLESLSAILEYRLYIATIGKIYENVPFSFSFFSIHLLIWPTWLDVN